MPSTETISNNTHPSSGDNSIENFHSPSTTTTTTSNNTTTSITSASPTAAGGCNHITTTSSHHDLQADEYSSPSSPPSPLSSSGGSTGLQQVWATHGSQALWKYKLNDLKNELKIKGLNVTGNKPNIINRLHSQYMAELSQQQQQQQNGGSQFVSPQQQQSSSSLDDHGDKSEQTPSSCSPPSSPTTTTVSTTVVAAVAATSTTTSANSAATVASTLTNNNSSGTPATTVAASTTTSTGMTTLPSKVTTIAPQTHVVKPPSRLPPFMPMSSIHSAAAGGSFYPTMPIAPPSRPKILVKPPSVIIPPPPAPSSSSSTALNARNAASLATAATTTTTEKSSVAMNGVGSGSVLPRNPTTSAPTASTASLTTATSLQKTSSLSARRRMAQKGVSVKSNKPAVSASAAVLMQMTDTPMSPQAPKTRLSALKAKPPSIIMPKPMTPLSDQSKYMTFSPHSSAQFLPFQNSSSSISRALKRKAGTRLPQFSSSSSHLLSSSTTGKPSKMMVAAKKVMMKSSSSSADQNQQIKKRGRPSHKGKTLSQDHIPSDLISLGPSRSSSINSYGMVKTIDYGSTSGIGSHHHHHYHNTSPIRSRNEDSQNTDSESESDMDNCLDYLVGSDDENYTMSSHNDSSTSYQASESVATTAPDCLDSIVPTREVNLIEDYIENVPNRKRALLDDTDFYGDVSYSTDASPYKRRKSDDVFGGAEEEEEDEEFDEEPFFFCGTTQEVPESIAESNLMEQTMGALQSEYSFEVSLAKNMTSSEPTSVSILSTLIEDDSETRKLSVGGNITLHELTKSILELFTYDRYGGLDNGLGIDSDSRYTMSLPYGIELSNPDANSQSGKSSEDLRVAGAKLGDRDTFYITFPCADDLSKTYCKFSIRVENIAITSSNDDTDILLTDEDNDSNLLGSILSDSYLNSYDGDNDSDDAPSEEDNATQSGDDMLDLLDSNLLLSI